MIPGDDRCRRRLAVAAAIATASAGSKPSFEVRCGEPQGDHGPHAHYVPS